MKFKAREATVEDISFIRSGEKYFESIYFEKIGFKEDVLEKIITDRKGYWWMFIYIITDINDNPIGYLITHLRNPKHGYVDYSYLLDINTIFISEECRGKKISRKIISVYMERLSKKFNIGGYIADVAFNNISSQKLFEALGFEKKLIVKDAFVQDDAIKYFKKKD